MPYDMNNKLSQSTRERGSHPPPSTYRTDTKYYKRKNPMRTKKFILPLAAVIAMLVIVLAACGAKASTTTTTGGTGSAAANGTPGAANLTQPLPLAESLLIGTLKLQGTSNAINATQAAALVPLWQAYAQLTGSTSAAQAEIDAVVSQIQSTMTPAQVSAITAMKLTRKDMAGEMSSLGLTYGGANGTPGFSGTPRAGGGGGGGGGFPGGGGFFPGGGAPGGGGAGGGGVPGAGGTTGSARPTPNATQNALRAQFANRIPTPLMNALVSYLQKTAGA
jgi:hypothetical protein